MIVLKNVSYLKPTLYYKVARITDEARERERKQEYEEANAGKKKNKKAKKREAEELENR